MNPKVLVWCLLICVFSVTSLQAQRKSKKQKFYFTQTSKTAEEIDQLNNKLDKIYYSYVGYFSNKAQADTTTSPLYREQEMISVPIWREQRKGEYWFYIMWAVPNKLDNPLAVFVYKLYKKDRDTTLLERFELPDDMKNTGWAAENPYNKFKPQDLIKTGCFHYLVNDENGHIKMLMPDYDSICVAGTGSRGYAYSRMQGSVEPSKFVLTTNFYDKDKRFLYSFGPTGNHYVRLPKTDQRYMELLYSRRRK